MVVIRILYKSVFMGGLYRSLFTRVYYAGIYRRKLCDIYRVYYIGICEGKVLKGGKFIVVHRYTHAFRRLMGNPCECVGI